MNEKNNNYQEALKPKDESEKKDNNQKESTIVKNFPAWDLLPPYQTIRRITRK